MRSMIPSRCCSARGSCQRRSSRATCLRSARASSTHQPSCGPVEVGAAREAPVMRRPLRAEVNLDRPRGPDRRRCLMSANWGGLTKNSRGWTNAQSSALVRTGGRRGPLFPCTVIFIRSESFVNGGLRSQAIASASEAARAKLFAAERLDHEVDESAVFEARACGSRSRARWGRRRHTSAAAPDGRARSPKLAVRRQLRQVLLR